MNNPKKTVTLQEELLKYLDPVDIALASFFANRNPENVYGCEIGVLFGGWSISLMLNSKSKIVGVDPFSWPQGGEAKNELFKNLKQHNLESRFELLSSTDELGRVYRSQFSIAHVDGEHSERATLADLYALVPLMTADGIIIVDDWCHPMFPGVHSAMHQFMAGSTFRVFAVTDRKAYLAPQSFAQQLQDELVSGFLLKQEFKWCWQHGRRPSGPGGKSEDMLAPEIGAIAEYEIKSHVLGQRVALILGNRQRP